MSISEDMKGKGSALRHENEPFNVLHAAQESQVNETERHRKKCVSWEPSRSAMLLNTSSSQLSTEQMNLQLISANQPRQTSWPVSTPIYRPVKQKELSSLIFVVSFSVHYLSMKEVQIE